MARIMLPLVLCCCFFSASGQKLKHKMSWGISFAPSITYRTLNYSKSQEFMADSREQLEKAKFGYTAAIVAQNAVGKKAMAELGLFISNTGYQTKKIPLDWSTANPEYPVSARFSYSYLHLGLMARYQYIVFARNLQVYAKPGLSFGGLIERKTSVVMTDRHGNKVKNNSALLGGFSETGFNAIVAIGARTRISNRLTICLEPTYMRAIRSVTPGSQNREYPYLLGLNTLLLYSKKINNTRLMK